MNSNKLIEKIEFLEEQNENKNIILSRMERALRQLNDIEFVGKKAEFIADNQKFSFEIGSTRLDNNMNTILRSKEQEKDTLGPFAKYRILLSDCIVT